MKESLTKRQEVIQSVIAGHINKAQAAHVLSCTTRTVENYRRRYVEIGKEGLRDKRRSNYVRLSERDKAKIIALKKTDRWRSSRNIADKLGLKVHEVTVWRVCKAANLIRENVERVKALQRFEAPYPNDLWQTDIMGKIAFPKVGSLYLIATIDDHSRFCLAGSWFQTQNKINVFLVWYEAMSRWGCPSAILQDQGTQYKARARFGIADYQSYANALGIQLIWARRAQTKGKIERFWKFVQGDLGTALAVKQHLSFRHFLRLNFPKSR